MKKVCLFSFVWLCFTFYKSSAQEVDVVWGPISEEMSGLNPITVGDLIFTKQEKNRGKDIYLCSVDKTTLETKEIGLVFGKSIDAAEYDLYEHLKLFAIKNQILQLTSKENKQTKELDLFIRKISTDGKRDEKLVKAISTHNPNSSLFLAASMSGVKPFDLIYNQDSSQVAIISTLSAEKNKNQDIKAVIINSKGDVEKNINFTIPIEPDLFHLHQVLFDQNNMIFLSSIQYTKEEKKLQKKVSKEKIEHYLKIFSLDLTQKAVKGFDSEFNIDGTGKVLSSIKILPKKNNVFPIVGFYRNSLEEDLSELYQGYFWGYVNLNTKSLDNVKYHEFSNDLYFRFKDFEGSKLKSGIPSYCRIIDVVEKTNGSYSIIAEYLNIYTKSTQRSTAVFHLYGPLFVLNISDQGLLKSEYVLRKQELSSNIGGAFSSVAYLEHKNKLYLIFNDHHTTASDQYFFENGEKTPLGHDCVPTLVVIEENGKSSKTGLSKLGDDGTFVIMPSKFRQINNHTLFFKSQKMKGVFGVMGAVPKNDYRGFLFRLK